MTTKREIEYTIKSKIDSWLYTISGQEECKAYPQTKLIDAIKDHYILTGGAIVSLLLGEEPNDWDIYFDDKFVAHNVIEYYLNAMTGFSSRGHGHKLTTEDLPSNPKFPWHNISYPGKITIEREQEDSSITFHEVSCSSYYGRKTKSNPNFIPFAPLLVTNNAISLNDGIQLIFRTIGNPAEIHRTFDFAHCVSYYTPKTGLVLNKFALESIMTKELKYIGSDFPVHSIFRMKKFIERGWTISQGEMLKMMWEISNLAFDKHTLSEQLFGGLNSPWEKMLAKYPDDGNIDRDSFRLLLDEKE